MKILGFGAVLWDEIVADGVDHRGIASTERHIGGAVFNVTVHLRKLGYDAYLLSAIGDDPLGATTRETMGRLGVSDRFVPTVDAPTCLIKVEFSANGVPHYSSPPLVSWDRIVADDAVVREIDRLGFDVIVFGTLEQRDPVSRQSLRTVLEGARFTTVYLDLTLRGQWYSRELLDYSMRKSNILKMNEEEARVVNDLFALRQTDLRKLLPAICREFGADIVCITLGGRGALIGDRRTILHRSGYRVEVKDTVGSGDAFSAGLLFMLGRGASLGDACDFANKMGALISSKRGALPDYDIRELEALPSQKAPATDSRTSN